MSDLFALREPLPRRTAFLLGLVAPALVLGVWCVLTYGGFAYLLPVVVTAIRAVPEELVQTARTLGASKAQVVRTVLLPAAMPEIFDSFRVMNAIAWTYVILAEAVNPERGLGYMVELARTHQKASWSFAGLIVIGGIGLVTDQLIRAISNVLFRWKEVDA